MLSTSGSFSRDLPPVPFASVLYAFLFACEEKGL